MLETANRLNEERLEIERKRLELETKRLEMSLKSSSGKGTLAYCFSHELTSSVHFLKYDVIADHKAPKSDQS